METSPLVLSSRILLLKLGNVRCHLNRFVHINTVPKPRKYNNDSTTFVGIV